MTKFIFTIFSDFIIFLSYDVNQLRFHVALFYGLIKGFMVIINT